MRLPPDYGALQPNMGGLLINAEGAADCLMNEVVRTHCCVRLALEPNEEKEGRTTVRKQADGRQTNPVGDGRQGDAPSDTTVPTNHWPAPCCCCVL